MKRIAFVSHLSELSGAGVALVKTCRAFKEKGYSTFLILPGSSDLLDYARRNELEPIIIPNPETAFVKKSILQKTSLFKARFVYCWRLYAFLQKFKIDVAYINSSTSLFAGLTARLARVPVAWHIHETLSSAGNSSAIRRKYIPKWADALVYASQSGKNALPPQKGQPTLIALNYVNIDEIVCLIRDIRQTGGAENDFILSSGASYAKGADILIEAVDRLTTQIEPHKLNTRIAGPSDRNQEFMADLKSRISDAKMSPSIALTGLQPSLIPSFAQSSVFVSASRSEALPIAIVEAMAARVPVIATDTGDCAALLEHGKCGWIIPVGAAAPLAAAIKEVLSNPELARQKADLAFAKVSELYKDDNFWDPLENLLNQISKKT